MYARFYGRMYAEPNDIHRRVVKTGFEDLQQRYFSELSRLLPDLAPGDAIRAKVRFYAVPGPVLPNGFDTQFHAFFDGIGAYGNTISEVELVRAGEPGAPQRVIDSVRRGIAAKIDAVLAEHGTSKENLLTATIFVTDLSQRPAMNEAWSAWLSNETMPARATTLSCGAAAISAPSVA